MSCAAETPSRGLTPQTPLSQALLEISNKGLGMTTDELAVTGKHLAGIFTDGDLRRALEARVDINATPMHQIMTTGAKTADAVRCSQRKPCASWKKTKSAHWWFWTMPTTVVAGASHLIAPVATRGHRLIHV